MTRCRRGHEGLRHRRIFWDLDGTLTDPGPGIIDSVERTLASLGLSLPPTVLRRFIGPPIHESFARRAGLNEADAWEAVRRYRSYMQKGGLLEGNRVWPGIPDLLSRLARSGCDMVVATSKPTALTHQVLRHFHLDHYFVAVEGASWDGQHSHKVDVLRQAVVHSARHPRVLGPMIGDHEADVEAAHRLGLACIAVRYGYGDPVALVGLGPEHLVGSVAELSRLLLSRRG